MECFILDYMKFVVSEYGVGLSRCLGEARPPTFNGAVVVHIHRNLCSLTHEAKTTNLKMEHEVSHTYIEKSA